MDQKQREEFRDIVLEAMAKKSWTSARTAKEAGFTMSTMTRITKALEVSPTTILKVRQALGIEALADAQAHEGYSVDIELVRDTIGLIMRDLPEAERPEFVRDIFEAVAKRPKKAIDSPPNE